MSPFGPQAAVEGCLQFRRCVGDKQTSGERAKNDASAPSDFDVAGAEVPSISLFGLHPAQQALWLQAVDVSHEGWMDRIAEQLTDTLGQLVCDLGRNGEAHVLKLSHPADAVLRRDDQPRMVRAVCPATVPER